MVKSVFLSCAWGQFSIFVSNDSTSNFLCTYPSDTSQEVKRYQDFHQIFSHRHFNRTKWDTIFIKKVVFCRILSVLLRIISIFYVKAQFYPLEYWKTQKSLQIWSLISCVLNKSSKSRKCDLSLQCTLSSHNDEPNRQPTVPALNMLFLKQTRQFYKLAGLPEMTGSMIIDVCDSQCGPGHSSFS